MNKLFRMNSDIQAYNNNLATNENTICTTLTQLIDQILTDAESKIWHSHPVWFLDDNPIVGFSQQKAGIRLMFWSGADFEETNLSVVGKKFKDASIFYTNVDQINTEEVIRWLEKSKTIQWDYKNIVKRKGQLIRL